MQGSFQEKCIGVLPLSRTTAHMRLGLLPLSGSPSTVSMSRLVGATMVELKERTLVAFDLGRILLPTPKERFATTRMRSLIAQMRGKRCPCHRVRFGTWFQMRLIWKFDLSTASRFPDLDEQYLISAPSFPVFGLGFPDLEPERTLGGSVTMGLRRPWVSMEVSGYSYRVDNYVYFSPVINEDGTPHVDVTVRGAEL